MGKELIAANGDSFDIVKPITHQDISFRLVKDSIATEGNNFLAFANDGSFCFVNVMLVNAVFKKHQLGLTVKVYDQKFNCSTVTRHFDGKDVLKLDENKLSATFEGNKVAYSPEERAYRITLQDEKPAKDGPKVEGEWLDLTFSAEVDGFKLGEGSTFYGKDKEDFAFLAFSMPRAKVSGKVVVDGKEFDFTGYGFVTKNLSNMTPHKLANTFHHCKLITPELTLALCRIETPKAFDKTIYAWGYLVENGKLVCATTKIEANWIGEGTLDPETKYVVPNKVHFKWQGKTESGEQFEAEVITEIKKENLLCRFDVLGHIPSVFRVVVEKMIARPYFYQYYEILEGSISIAGNKRTVSGRCLHEYHFIND